MVRFNINEKITLMILIPFFIKDDGFDPLDGYEDWMFTKVFLVMYFSACTLVWFLETSHGKNTTLIDCFVWLPIKIYHIFMWAVSVIPNLRVF